MVEVRRWTWLEMWRALPLSLRVKYFKWPVVGLLFLVVSVWYHMLLGSLFWGYLLVKLYREGPPPLVIDDEHRILVADFTEKRS